MTRAANRVTITIHDTQVIIVRVQPVNAFYDDMIQFRNNQSTFV